MVGKGLCGNSLLTSQFICESKTAIKNSNNKNVQECLCARNEVANCLSLKMIII